MTTRDERAASQARSSARGSTGKGWPRCTASCHCAICPARAARIVSNVAPLMVAMVGSGLMSNPNAKKVAIPFVASERGVTVDISSRTSGRVNVEQLRSKCCAVSASSPHRGQVVTVRIDLGCQGRSSVRAAGINRIKLYRLTVVNSQSTQPATAPPVGNEHSNSTDVLPSFGGEQRFRWRLLQLGSKPTGETSLACVACLAELRASAGLNVVQIISSRNGRRSLPVFSLRRRRASEHKT